MFQAIKSPILNCSLLGLILLLNACNTELEERNTGIQAAREYQANNQPQAALAELEALNNQFPKDSEILHLIGQTHAQLKDPIFATFFTEQAAELQPLNAELRYEVYLLAKAADLPHTAHLKKLSQLDAQMMRPNMWLELGAALEQANELSAALDAYLATNNADPSLLEKAAQASIGDLYLQLDNLNQAESWLKKAQTVAGEPDQRLHSGLLQLAILKKDWPAAEKKIEALDKAFPNFLDASKFSQVREEVQEWRAKKDAAERALAEQKAAIEAPQSPEDTPTGSSQSGTENAATESKASLSEEAATAEALALAPAIEYYQAPPEATEASTSSDAVDNQLTDIASDAAEPAELAPASPSPAERIAEIMTQAEQAEIEQDLTRAIERYWEAIAIDNQRASIWSQLAQVYRRDQQLKNAESTALEAIRLDTNNINYTLDYLRIIQNSKAPKAFLAELETAYARFPLSPEITLSLARAYRKISIDVEAARQFYQRFIEIAPAHPLRAEADAVLQTLQ